MWTQLQTVRKWVLILKLLSLSQIETKCEAGSCVCSIYATLKYPLCNDSEPTSWAILILRPLPKNISSFHSYI